MLRQNQNKIERNEEEQVVPILPKKYKQMKSAMDSIDI